MTQMPMPNTELNADVTGDPIVIVNGVPYPLGRAETLAHLFVALGVGTAKKAIERNGEIIPVSALERTPVAPNDHIEVIQFVGGG